MKIIAIVLFVISLVLSGNAGKMQKQLQNRQNNWGTIEDVDIKDSNKLNRNFETSSIIGIGLGYLSLMLWLISVSRAFKNKKKPRFQLIIFFVILFFFIFYVDNFMNYVFWAKPFWLYQVGH